MLVERMDPCSMVLVMGVTGAGKSYFVNRLAAGAVAEGPGLKSETEVCQVVRVGVGNHEVAVVDTPGFDDTTKSDAEILDEIVQFLCAQYRLGIPLKGIIYMHRITDVRMQGSSLRYFEMFKSLCGEQNLRNVVLLTTMWGELRDEAKGIQRERELRKDYWREMERGGSFIRRYDGSKSMAEAMICRLMRERDIVLDIQNELVDQGKMLEETRAGKLLMPRIEHTIGESEDKIQRLQLLIEDADVDNSQVIDLEKERDKLIEEQRKNASQLNRLKRRIGLDVVEKIEKEEKKDKWRSRIAVFGSILGLVITTTVNVILPLAGVSLFLN